jgi:hypothetical protein
MALQPKSGPGLPFWGFLTITSFGTELLVQRPIPNLEDQVSVLTTPGDRVAQLYPQTLGTHFSRPLRHALVTVGLLFNPGHHTGINVVCYPGMCLDRLKKVTKNLSHWSRSPGEDLNQGRPEYKTLHTKCRVTGC